jgi:hypothetical protein
MCKEIKQVLCQQLLYAKVKSILFWTAIVCKQQNLLSHNYVNKKCNIVHVTEEEMCSFFFIRKKMRFKILIIFPITLTEFQFFNLHYA